MCWGAKCAATGVVGVVVVVAGRTLSFSPALTTYVPTRYVLGNSSVTIRPLTAAGSGCPGSVVDTESGLTVESMTVPAIHRVSITHSQHPIDEGRELEEGRVVLTVPLLIREGPVSVWVARREGGVGEERPRRAVELVLGEDEDVGALGGEVGEEPLLRAGGPAAEVPGDDLEGVGCARWDGEGCVGGDCSRGGGGGSFGGCRFRFGGTNGAFGSSFDNLSSLISRRSLRLFLALLE